MTAGRHDWLSPLMPLMLSYALIFNFRMGILFPDNFLSSLSNYLKLTRITDKIKISKSLRTSSKSFTLNSFRSYPSTYSEPFRPLNPNFQNKWPLSPRNRWRFSIGISGGFQSELVAVLLRNGWRF